MNSHRRNFSFVNLILLLVAVVFTYGAATANNLAKSPLIPKPVQLTSAEGYFELDNQTTIQVPLANDTLLSVAKYLSGLLRPATGFDLVVKTGAEEIKENLISLDISQNNPSLGQEGYEMAISTHAIRLTANSAEGIFRGIQTLRQLLPATIEHQQIQKGPWKVAAGTILDYPAYAYRGAMLDVARHFFTVAEVRRFIDLMALYKMNYLHLHLADDQGWRIEIKSWPALTTIGSTTQVGGGKGGFYSQEEYRQLVKYAADQFITIVPEIDMPGHTNAALASIPELNPNNQPTQLYTGTHVGFSTLQTNSEFTYRFLNDVIRELAAMTPGPYIHVGGDESHVTRKEDYIPFVEKVQDIVIANEKKMIGWDETTLSALKPGTIVQYWSKADNALRGAAKGVKIIMSPAAKAYLDMKYNPKTKLGLHWAGYIEVDAGYKWDPATLVPGLNREQILGIEAPLWSETVSDINQIESLLFPRLPGYAEIGWSPAEHRKWEDYKIRLGHQGERFRIMGIDYYASPKVPWK